MKENKQIDYRFVNSLTLIDELRKKGEAVLLICGTPIKVKYETEDPEVLWDPYNGKLFVIAVSEDGKLKLLVYAEEVTLASSQSSQEI